jgi:hypothetical protein
VAEDGFKGATFMSKDQHTCNLVCMASYCLKRMKKLTQNGPRKFLPLPKEIKAIEVFFSTLHIPIDFCISTIVKNVMLHK